MPRTFFDGIIVKASANTTDKYGNPIPHISSIDLVYLEFVAPLISSNRA